MTFDKIAHTKFVCFVCGILLALFASLALLSLIVPQKAYAQRLSDLSTVKVDGVSKETQPSDAIREVSTWALATTAHDRVVEVVGEQSYQKNKAAIDQKIIKQSAKFIPFVNPGEPARQRDGSWRIPIELKISGTTLRKMLLENGFVGSAAGAANILPLIAFTDRTRALSLRWWMGDEKNADQKSLSLLETLLHAKLAEEIQKQNLVFTKPPAPEQISEIPNGLRIERPSSSDISAIGAYFKSAMIARGDVRLLPSTTAGAVQVSVKIQVVQVNAPDRVIAEVMREFSTDPHAASVEAGLRAKAGSEFASLARDLSSQVQVAWQRGTVGTNFLTLTVRGALTPAEQSAFKTEFARALREARDLKERLFERDQVTYEVDYSGDPNQFANRLLTLKLVGFEVKVPPGQSGSRAIAVDVQPLASVQ